MFVGRQEQITALSQLWDKRTSSLVTCRGRRRIGKSTLIEEFARRSADRFINIVGIPPRKGMTDLAQRRNFCEELAVQTGSTVATAQNWLAAFKSLDAAIPLADVRLFCWTRYRGWDLAIPISLGISRLHGTNGSRNTITLSLSSAVLFRLGSPTTSLTARVS